MLVLDYEHRAGGPLPPPLRARLRGQVARANGCTYGEACAAADLLRSGGGRLLAGADLTRLPEAEQAALEFARKLTLSPAAITDAEVARLVEWYGDRQVVAIVLLVAYANFLDRLVVALNLPADASALAPLEVRFAALPLGASRAALPRKGPDNPRPPNEALPAAEPSWQALDFKSLQQAMARQRSLRPRLPLPEGQGSSMRWGQLCRTYQPQLANAWISCKQAFEAEANQDRVFEASLFWIVTRTQRSFY
jgi:hypothetical protein